MLKQKHRVWSSTVMQGDPRLHADHLLYSLFHYQLQHLETTILELQQGHHHLSHPKHLPGVKAEQMTYVILLSHNIYKEISPLKE